MLLSVWPTNITLGNKFSNSMATLGFTLFMQVGEVLTVLAAAGLVDLGGGYCNTCHCWAVILPLNVCHFFR